MTRVNQVIERMDEATLPEAQPPPAKPGDASATCRPTPAPAEGFSPDPARRTDRYRLVTPYCLRL